MELLAASFGVHDLPLFLAAGLLLNITPGADLLYVAGHAATGGRRAGMLAALGIGVGCLFHVTLATVGLSAVLASSDLAFNLVKWAGAGYLIWMGISMLFARRASGPAQAETLDAKRVFWRGALTNAMNPKVALFFLAFLPQFISPQAPRQWLAFALLGILFTIGGTGVSLTVAWLAGSARERFLNGPSRIGPCLQRAAGLMFVGLGLKLAVSGR